MNKAYSYILSLITAAVCLAACEKKIDLELDPDYNILVVEGYLTNFPEQNYIKVSYALPYNEQGTAFTPPDAQLRLFENKEIVYELEYNADSARYEYPVGFMPEVGKSYQLEIVDGNQTFRSANELMLPQAKIDSAYIKITQQAFFGQDSINLYTPYLLSADPDVNQKNHYRIKGVQLPDSDDFLEDIVVLNDDFLQVAPDGMSIISTAPIRDDQIDDHLEYMESPDSILRLKVEYWHIQPSFEDFLRLLDQTDFAGSPYDPPAPAVRGNIKEVRDDEMQVWAQGHFVVAAIDTTSLEFKKVED